MRKNKQNEIIGTTLSLILLIILVVIYNAPQKDFKNFFHKITYPVRIISFNIKNKNTNIENYGSLEEVKQKIKTLQKENDKLKADAEVKNMLLEDNKKLSELLNLKNKYKEFDVIPAEIKYRSDNNFSNYVIINIGKSDGIEEDMVLVSESGLYGKIEEVYENESKVQAITDATSKISVNVGKESDIIIAQGSIENNKKLIATLIPEHLKINVGDLVFTSGVGGIYPKGIFVGTVSGVNNSKNISDKKAIIDIKKSFNEVQNLLVIKK